MKKTIIIKYGELTTKKDNISFFINILKNNIKAVLPKAHIEFDHGRMFIYEHDTDNVIEKLKNTFGIHEINIAYEIDGNNYENIEKNLLKTLENKNFKTFKIISKRSNKNFPINSMELNRKLGSLVLRNVENIKVDVHNPELEINVEVRSKKTLIYFEKIKGLGGYPVGTLGKGMLMLSGGIDSPVAGYLALKRGIRLEAIYFESPPHTSDNAKNKVLALAKKLTKYSNYIKVHIVKFTDIQEAIYKNIPEEYGITIMRRMMYRISEKISCKINAKVLINGESIGQVASQTLTSINVINRVSNIPVIRPLACFDKIDIINIAKKIKTYNISIEPYEDCCTIFIPRHPVINPVLEAAEKCEKLIPYEELINKALKTVEVKKINNLDEEFVNIL